MCDDLVKNVKNLLPYLERMINGGKIEIIEALAAYKQLLVDIRDFLEIHIQKKPLQRLACHWNVKDKIKLFYVQRDQIVERMELEFQEEAANRHEYVSNRIENVIRREQRIEDQAAKEFQDMQELINSSIDELTAGITDIGSEVMTMLRELKFQYENGLEQSEKERKFLLDTMNKFTKASMISSLPDWYISRANIRFESSPFAEGSTRTLHFGKLDSGAKVVVKVSNAAHDDTDSRTRFNAEVEKWYPLRNPHVLPLYGACNITAPQLFVLGFAEKGNFNEFLPKHDHLFWKVFLDAARGLAYLHSRKLVHANLKCSNLLVMADGTGVVSDFCFAFVRISTILSFKVQTPSTRWKAPECLQFGLDKNARHESDVYSLGMCLIEGLTGKPPFDGVNEMEVFAKVRAGELPTRSEKITDEAWSLITAMCAKEFQDRIKLGEVIRLMEILAEREHMMLGRLKCSCTSGSCRECGKSIAHSELEAPAPEAKARGWQLIQCVQEPGRVSLELIKA
ncbi:Serine/threonine protein kinase [Phytophthora megakarya]|uniref:Serine/threonine protein kinase n=1 Tax=Phytophthora megakarya TaxID=4795 RepID=A0A225VJ79_9STRA|nr:Serine/threonine protein kinase [Phytophthora megakarya]